MSRYWHRRQKILALLGALLLGLSALVATQNWPAERAAKWILAANGVHAERLEIESWGLGHVSLRHLTIHQPVALTAEQVRVDWQIGAENPIKSIRVQTLEVHLPKPSPDSAAPRAAISDLSKQFRQHRSVFERSSGLMPLLAATNIETLWLVLPDAQRIPIQITSKALEDTAAITFSANAQTDALRGDARVEIGWEPARDHVQAKLMLSDLRYALSEREAVSAKQLVVALDLLTRSPSVVAVTFDAQRLAHEHKKPVIAPLSFAGNATYHHGVVEMNTQITDRRKRLSLEAKLTHNLDTDQGLLTLQSSPLQFTTGEFQPDDVIPRLRGKFSSVEGSLAASAVLGWTQGKLVQQDLILATEKLTAKIFGVLLQDLESTLVLNRLMPPRTPDKQTVKIGVAQLGLPLTRGELNFEITQSGELVVDESVWECAGGQLTLAPLRLKLDEPIRQQLVLSVKEVQVGQLLGLVLTQGLTAEGAISGNIPLSITPEGVLIDHASLESLKGGVIRYQPAGAGGEAIKQAPQGALLMQALQNFHFRDLSMSLHHDSPEKLRMTAHISGSNPDLLSGKAIELNIDLTGNFADIVQQTMQAYSLQEALEEKVNAR